MLPADYHGGFIGQWLTDFGKSSGARAMPAAEHNVRAGDLASCLPVSRWRLAVTLGCLAGLLARGLPAARAAEESQGPDAGLSGLVGTLGHASWSEREDAQARLLATGLTAAPLLEAAARSERNPEIAYRARYILSRIDPNLSQCQVLKIALEPRPHIAAVAEAAGSEGTEITARPRELPGKEAGRPGPPGYPESPAYSVQIHSLGPAPETPTPEGSPGATYQVAVRQLNQSYGQLDLRTTVVGPRGAAIVRVGDQCLQERLGARLTRTRHPFITLLRVRMGRKSQVGPLDLPPDGEKALLAVAGDALLDLESGDARARQEALLILSYLRATPGAAGLVRLADDPEASPEERALALLALDDHEKLRAIFSSRRAPAAGGVGAPDPGENHSDEEEKEDDLPVETQVRAGTRLLLAGDVAGLGALLQRLAEGDPGVAHELVATLADFVSSDRARPEEKLKVFEVAFAETTLGHSIWEDAELEHFLLAVAGALDPALPGAPEAGRSALGALARLGRGELASVNFRLRTLLDVGRAVRRHTGLPGSEDLELVLGLLESPGGISQPSDLLGALEIILQDPSSRPEGDTPAVPENSLDDARFRRLLDALLAPGTSGDTSALAVAAQALVRASRMLHLRAGQLSPLVGALVDLGTAIEASRTEAQNVVQAPGVAGGVPLHRRQIEEELLRWTGVSAPAVKAESAAGALLPWKEWLGRSAEVAAREAEILRLGGTPAETTATTAPGGGRPPPPPRDLVYYEFDLVLEQPPPRAGATKPAFRLLDGRRLELRGKNSASFTDRWGNVTSVRLEEDSSLARTGKGPRFRVNSRGYLFPGLPALSTLQSRNVGVAWYETSDLYFGSRPLGGGTSTAFRTLQLVDLLETEATGAPPAAASAEELWRLFVERRLLDLDRSAPRERWTSVLGVLRALRLREGIPLLRRALEEQPSVDLAQQLLELEDPAGEAALRKLLESNTPQERFAAALALTENGKREGVERLVELAEQTPPMARGQGYRLVGALDAYLQGAAPDPGARKKAIGYLVSKLDDPVFQIRAFAILDRESGLDLGLGAAQGLNDPQEKARAITRAIQTARSWWNNAREGR